jgi:hypothetical protein
MPYYDPMSMEKMESGIGEQGSGNSRQQSAFSKKSPISSLYSPISSYPTILKYTNLSLEETQVGRSGIQFIR